MLLPNQKVQVKWWVNNKEHFVEKGYKFTKYKDLFLVDVKDLCEYSDIKVKVVCDFCGNIYEPIYKNYIRNHDETTGDCCKSCKVIKSCKTNTERRGVPYPTQDKDVIEKSRNTFKEKYGVDWISKSKEYHKMVENTCIEKYGVKNPFQSQDVKDKTKQTNMQKYGVPYAMQNKDISYKSRINANKAMCKNGSNDSQCTEVCPR